MKRALHLDIETFSEADLKAAGAYVYAEHPSTEILVFCWAFGNDAVETWRPGDPLPEKVVRHINEGGEVRAHNASFERVILNGVAGKRIGFPYISIEQTVCTAAKVAAHGLPRALGDAAKALEVQPKDDAGRNTMLMVSKPRRGSIPRYTRENAPEKFAILDDYCKNDVEVERAIDNAVPDLPASELLVYHLDQRINDRGIGVDLEAIDNAQYVVDRYRDELHKKCIELTGLAPTQRDKIAGWVRANGYPDLIDMQAETVKRAVADPTVPDNVKTVLKIFSTYGNKAVAKLESMKEAVCTDGRLKGMFLYHGANTGRWSSLKVQLQNLFRGVIPDPENAIDILSARDLDWVRAMYPGVDPMKVVASCVRGMLVPAEGKVLQAIDYAGIESRVNAWLFGEQWKLKAFRDFDAGIGPDLYALAYARAFRVRLTSVTKQQRQVGKVMELACFAADTEVLTRRGYKAIAEVLNGDELWDGVEWVRHAGVVAKGARPVVLVDGIKVTPDHLIATPQTWLPARQLVSNGDTLSLALAHGSANLPWWAKLRQIVKETACSFNVLAGQPRTAFLGTTYEGARQHVVANAQNEKLVARNSLNGTRNTPHFSPTQNTGGGFSTDLLRPSAGVTVSRPPVTPITEVAVSKWRQNGVKTTALSWRTSSLFRGGINRISKWIGSTLTGTMSRVTSDLSPNEKTISTGETPEKCSNESTCLRQVFDIALAGPRNRFTVKTRSGHLIAHNCGYEGGVGAFVTMADTYGLNLDEMAAAAFSTIPPETLESAAWMWHNHARPQKKTYDLPEKVYLVCDSLKQLWRANHPRIKDGWGLLRQAAVQAVDNPGGVYGLPDKKVLFRKANDWLYMRLPSGRRIAYYKPEMAGDKLTYMGVDTYTRHYCRTSTYGGKLTENAVQAIARDVLVNGMLRIEAAGYPIVATVHDEAVAEIDEEFGSIEEAGREMCVLPDWATGLPLAVEGWRAKRYKK